MTATITSLHNDPHWDARCDLAAAFRWAARYDLHEGVANHFSYAVSDDGRRFLVNPNCMHFSRIKASDMLLLDADDPATLEGPNAPDPTAWGLHGGIHRLVPHAKCAIHVHSHYATALASLQDSRLLPVDQNAAIFFNRVVIDEGYEGLAFEEEGERCAKLFADPSHKVMIMGNHGVLVIGETIGETFDRMYIFERACRNYLTALSTGQALRVMPDEVAERVAREIEDYPVEHEKHLAELRLILDAEGSDYAR